MAKVLNFNPNDAQYQARLATYQALEFFEFKDDYGETIQWTEGQVEMIDCIIHRQSLDKKNRIQVLCMTRYGKSLSIAAAVLILASTQTHKIAIVAGTDDKAQIIMDYMIMLGLNCDQTRHLLTSQVKTDKLRERKSKDRIYFANTKSEVRVFSAGATQKSSVSTSLMGFGAPNVIEDEAALIPDPLQAVIMRMLGDNPEDNFLVKIGNPFNRNHFLDTWESERYYHVFIDWHKALHEGRVTQAFIDEMREGDKTMFDINYGCLFPPEDAITSDGYMNLILESLLQESQNRQLTPVGEYRLGVDVARGGRDYNVMVLRRDNIAWIIKKWQPSRETDGAIDSEIADEVIKVIREYNITPANVFIDDTGVGGGVTDFCKYKGYPITPVILGSSASNSADYVNLRAELYAGQKGLKWWLEQGASLQPSQEWDDMLTIRYRKNPAGKTQIESKEDMRKRGHHSPDVTDALILTFSNKAVYKIPKEVYTNAGKVNYF